MTVSVRARAACGMRSRPLQERYPVREQEQARRHRVPRPGYVLLRRFHGGPARGIVQHGLRGDPSVGIHFAEQRETPASNDLGSIRPPGGVPLFPSGAEITVQAGDAATKRLEAAPAKDLDKWVAELERLTGKKPEGWVEQQGWHHISP